MTEYCDRWSQLASSEQRIRNRRACGQRDFAQMCSTWNIQRHRSSRSSSRPDQRELERAVNWQCRRRRSKSCGTIGSRIAPAAEQHELARAGFSSARYGIRAALRSSRTARTVTRSTDPASRMTRCERLRCARSTTVTSAEPERRAPPRAETRPSAPSTRPSSACAPGRDNLQWNGGRAAAEPRSNQRRRASANQTCCGQSGSIEQPVEGLVGEADRAGAPSD